MCRCFYLDPPFCHYVPLPLNCAIIAAAPASIVVTMSPASLISKPAPVKASLRRFKMTRRTKA